MITCNYCVAYQLHTVDTNASIVSVLSYLYPSYYQLLRGLKKLKIKYLDNLYMLILPRKV
jgi:hypothetical protein